MKQQFKRSFMGFRKDEVENEITVIELEHANKMKACESDLTKLALKNQNLKDEIKKIELKIDKSKEVQQKITVEIYKMYMEFCEKTYLMQQKYEEMVTYKKSILHVLEESNSLINKNIEKLEHEKSSVRRSTFNGGSINGKAK